MNELTNIENSLEASTAKDNLLDIIGGAADYTIDHLLSLGDGIPIVSHFTKGLKASLAVRDFLFMEKVIEFLLTVSPEPTPNRKSMIDNIQNDDRYRQKFGKVSLIALERYDNISKAKLLGIAAKYLARDEINFEIYQRFAFTLDKMFVNDIYAFTKHDEWDGYKIAGLESLGLIENQLTVKVNNNNSNQDPRQKAYGRSLPTTNNVSVRGVETLYGQVFRLIITERPLNELHGYVAMDVSEAIDMIKESFSDR